MCPRPSRSIAAWDDTSALCSRGACCREKIKKQKLVPELCSFVLSNNCSKFLLRTCDQFIMMAAILIVTHQHQVAQQRAGCHTCNSFCQKAAPMQHLSTENMRFQIIKTAFVRLISARVWRESVYSLNHTFCNTRRGRERCGAKYGGRQGRRTERVRPNSEKCKKGGDHSGKIFRPHCFYLIVHTICGMFAVDIQLLLRAPVLKLCWLFSQNCFLRARTIHSTSPTNNKSLCFCRTYKDFAAN